MTPYINDPDFTLYVGDVRDVLSSLPDESVHCVVTSPPYWGLRDYGTGLWDGGDPDCDHLGAPFRTKSKLNENWGAGFADVKNAEDREPFKDVCGKCGARRVDRQLGLEATPDLYVENMVAVFREVRRVLRRDGTCWLNLGDSYATDHAQKRSQVDELGRSLNTGKHASTPGSKAGETRGTPAGLKPKDLVGVPWRVAFALQADGWYLRADVIWSKPNPMPESVSDRPTKAHEYLFLLTKSPRYFYDADAVREPHNDKTAPIGADGLPAPSGGISRGQARSQGWNGGGGGFYKSHIAYNPAGRNRRSVWEIATEPYPDAHFATFPQALVEPCVKAGTSERGCCPVCGAPWERETETERVPHWKGGHKGFAAEGTAAGMKDGSGEPRMTATVRTVGWQPSCRCDLSGRFYAGPVPCTVLDPFMGSGTTALVARRLGRRSVGVELNETYAKLAARRLAQLSLLA